MYEFETVRTLGLYQPFATLIKYGKIETRQIGKSKAGIWRKPPFPPGKYLIYSCQEAYHYAECHLLMGSDIFDHACRVAKNDITYMRRGIAICMVDLISVVDPIPRGLEYLAFLKYERPGEEKRRVGLVFINPIPIVPFEFSGKQGIGFLSDEDKLKIKLL